MSPEKLPDAITRPLRRTAWSIVGFVTLFSLWAVYAPLATTLHLSGNIVSSRPTFELQHPYGGQIGQVLVRRLDPVQAGQTLLRLDTSLEAKQLKALSRTRAQYLGEIEIIEELLRGRMVELANGAAASNFAQRYRQAMIQSHQQNRNAAFLNEQATALAEKVSLIEQQLSLMLGRRERQQSLSGKGLVTKTDGEVLEEQILLVQSEIQGERASLASLRGQAESARQQAELVMLAVVEQLVATRDANATRVNEVDRQIAGLRDQIDAAVVQSPVDGIVSDIHFEATGMYAARGATLISLTQPLNQPQVRFRVPVSQIDQIQPGMTGRLVLTSLSQRAMPRIDIQVVSVSPRASEDEQGNPVSYSGLAAVDAAAVEVLHTAMDGIALMQDMPAQLILEVRDMTFSQYILNPFRAAFRNALQD